MTTDCRIDELPWQRWFALTVLLVAEIALLSVRFDTGALGEADGIVAAILGIMPQLLRLGSIVIAAILLIGAPALIATLEREWPRRHTTSTNWREQLLTIHFAGLLLFLWLTWSLLEQGHAVGEGAMRWLLLWLVGGALSGTAWALMAMPGAIWWQLAVQRWRSLAIGAGIGISVWTIGLFASRLWTPLAACTLRAVHGALSVLYNDTIFRAHDFTVGTSSFQVTIAPECSGYEGIGLVVAFLVAYLLYRGRYFRFPHCLVLLPIGAIMIWCLNALRIAALIAIGTSWSRSIALGGFHSQAGWLAFIAVALGTVAVARRIRWLSADRAPEAAETATPAFAYLVPFLALIGTGMITAAISVGFDMLYPLRIVVASMALWCFRRHHSLRPLLCPRAIVAGTAVFVLWLVLPALDGDLSSVPAPAPGPPNFTGSWWLWRTAGFLVIVPVVEELAFRGFLMRRLSALDFRSVSPEQVSWPAIFWSSAAFGALHGAFWLAGSVAGAAYAMAWCWRGRLADSIVAHATTNALLAIYVLKTGHWSLWP